MMRGKARVREEETGLFKMKGTTRERGGAGTQANPRSLWERCCGRNQQRKDADSEDDQEMQEKESNGEAKYNSKNDF